VAGTEAAGVECPGTKAALKDFVGYVRAFREALVALEKAVAHKGGAPERHAVYIRDEVRPAMSTLRGAADLLENHMAADLWPLPTYRELLVLK
jgi:glutamine synthetase